MLFKQTVVFVMSFSSDSQGGPTCIAARATARLHVRPPGVYRLLHAHAKKSTCNIVKLLQARAILFIAK